MTTTPKSVTEVAAGQVVPPTTGTSVAVPPVVAVAVTPTQVRRPWRATVRTGFAAGVAIAAMLPELVDASGIDDSLPAVGGALAIAGGITRVMALPKVEVFLRTFLPFLAAAPATPEQK